MWETTGNEKYLADFEAKIQEQQSMVDENWDWGNIKNMGVFTYLMSKREGKNPELFNSLKQKTIETANQIANKAQSDIFNRYSPVVICCSNLMLLRNFCSRVYSNRDRNFVYSLLSSASTGIESSIWYSPVTAVIIMPIPVRIPGR